MVATKVILAVAVVSAFALVQIDARPSTTTGENWAEPFETAFKNLAANVTSFIGEHSNITDVAKNGLSSYAESFKSELTSFSKKLEGKSGLSDIINNATQQFQSTVEALNKSLPVELTPAKLAEKYQEAQKTVKATAEDLWKKAGGNADIETEVKSFTKKQLDALTEQFQSYQKKLAESNKQ